MNFPKDDTSTLRVLIIGCGNIAGGFDLGRSKCDAPQTHAGAYISDGRFDMAICVEPNQNRRVEFMETWEVDVGFDSIEEIDESAFEIDVISICSPTVSHTRDLSLALRLGPKLIFCEKPLTESIEDSATLIAECRGARIPLAVNYTRRWDPSITKIRAQIIEGRWGELRSVVGLYNKGILNNGSHMVDLLQLLVGPVEIVHVGKPINDFFSKDPTVPVWLESASGVPVYLACGHALDYAIFELQMIFSEGVLTMEDGGFFWRERRAGNSERFKGYRVLGADSKQPGEIDLAMSKAVDNIYRTVTRGDPLASTGENALAAQGICERIKELGLKL